MNNLNRYPAHLEVDDVMEPVVGERAPEEDAVEERRREPSGGGEEGWVTVCFCMIYIITIYCLK